MRTRKDTLLKLTKAFVAYSLACAIAVAPLAGCSSQTTGASGADASEGSSQASVATSDVTANASDAAANASDASANASDGDKQFVLYLGTNDKDTNKPVYSPEESKERAKAILMKDFGGYTIQGAEGGWRGDDGTEYQEYTLVIYLSDTTIDEVHAAAKELIDEFHQSSVLINTERVKTEFYDGE
ncbi:MAG: DUF3574 domain-containing protein [Atopobiaceae bacterium]|nr:DUF3574 domain-containing protein [Atopobiaceae bacterium]